MKKLFNPYSPYISFSIALCYLLADDAILDGAALTQQHCAGCHSEQGNGIDNMQ